MTVPTPTDLTEEGRELLKAIDAYKVGEDLREAVTEKLTGEYNKLRNAVCVMSFEKCMDLEKIILDLELVESIWCEQSYEDDPKYKHKDGSWKLRTLLPKGYSSAKAVILKALKCGVLDNSSGKSALERKIKAYASTVIPVLTITGTIEEEFRKFTDTLRGYIGSPSDPYVLSLCVEYASKLNEYLENEMQKVK